MFHFSKLCGVLFLLSAAQTAVATDASSGGSNDHYPRCRGALSAYVTCLDQRGHRQCYEAHYNSVRAACPSDIINTMWDEDTESIRGILNQMGGN
ncbi:hypothetical protein BB8028_0004g01220 [Beauveria bassiana]|uniref:Uncharacterized protein n=1 Tax=Beauveria bassiana TaxID=176275 RepID=A0A2S7YAI5_BEABA|nr:hypothetical protein BB8028_0004g01220 [Beauveria bassiana]